MKKLRNIQSIISEKPTRDRVFEITRLIREHGGRPFLVGGFVRDAILGGEIKDVDMEVYGIQPETLKQILSSRFPVDLIGESFAVLKIKKSPIEISLPRRDRKIGSGHKGFEIESDPDMDPKEAASRRDFTINSMMAEPDTGEIHDFFGGQDDLDKKILRHTSDHFPEDPLRVLRGMQFAARFLLETHPDTIALCRSISMDELPPERIFDEWKKMILKAEKPSIGLQFLRDCGWIDHFPELAATIDCPQEERWHPEGDVWNHTLISIDAFAKERIGVEWEDLVVGFATLCHDFGKPETTVFERDRIRSPRHEKEGENLAKSFLKRMTNHGDLIAEVLPLVAHHMKVYQFHKDHAGDSAIRRLARSVGRIDRLVRVYRADQKGCPMDDRITQAPEDNSAGDWLLKRAEQLAVADRMPKPIIQGRHLIKKGLKPSPEFGPILKACFEAQLDGAFDDESGGIKFLEDYMR